MQSVRSCRGRRWAAALIALAAVLAPAVQAAAAPPGPTPTHKNLQQARRQAQATQHKLDKAKQAVSGAHDDLVAKADVARQAIDAYARTMRQVNRARVRAAAAAAREAAASARVASELARVQEFARAAYMSGGPVTTLAVILAGDSPTAVLDRASLLNQVSQSQAAMLRALAAAQQAQAAAATVAQRAQAAVERVAARADAQRRSALIAMANQEALLQRLSSVQAKATTRLAHQENQVKQLALQRAAARQAAIAAQRAELAAAWASMQDVGDSMPWATAEQGRQAVAAARDELGMPYSWAGGDADGPTLGAVNEFGNPAGLTTMGFDCSGLTLFAWGQAGFSLDHYTGYQWVEGHQIALDALRPGDLVFFATDVSDPLTIHHVGIYVGGDRMIDAPHTGANVRYDRVFVPGLIGAIRP